MVPVESCLDVDGRGVGAAGDAGIAPLSDAAIAAAAAAVDNPELLLYTRGPVVTVMTEPLSKHSTRDQYYTTRYTS